LFAIHKHAPVDMRVDSPAPNDLTISTSRPSEHSLRQIAAIGLTRTMFLPMIGPSSRSAVNVMPNVAPISL